MANEPVKIPMEDDYGIYAKMLLQYRSQKTQKNLALLTLAQRVVLEKGRNTYKKRGEQSKVIEKINQINNNLDICRGYSARLDVDNVVGIKYPLYKKAGLI